VAKVKQSFQNPRHARSERDGSRVCGEAAVVRGQHAILLFVVFEHVIGIPAVGLKKAKNKEAYPVSSFSLACKRK
jgi:hypothetical protein